MRECFAMLGVREGRGMKFTSLSEDPTISCHLVYRLLRVLSDTWVDTGVAFNPNPKRSTYDLR